MNTQNQNPAVNLVMTAPETQSEFERKDQKDIVKIQPGNHLGRLYGIVDLGIQINTRFQKKSKRIALLFEFPHLMQSFYKNNEEVAPTMIKCEFTYSMHPKSNFRKFIESGIGVRLSDDDAKKFNIFGILGNWFTCNVMHDPDKRDPNNVYERINFIQPFDARFQVQGVDYTGINKLMAYSIQAHGFQGDAWKGLWKKFRDQLKQSEEGQEHASKGGVFEEVKYNNDDSNATQTNTYQGPSAPSGQAMQPTQNVSQPNMAQPSIGQPQQSTQMGVPNTQGVVPPNNPGSVPAQTKKQFVILTEPKDFNVWAQNDWTEELMIQHGHAKYVESPL